MGHQTMLNPTQEDYTFKRQLWILECSVFNLLICSGQDPTPGIGIFIYVFDVLAWRPFLVAHWLQKRYHRQFALSGIYRIFADWLGVNTPNEN